MIESRTTPSFRRRAKAIALRITNGAREQGSKVSKLITILAADEIEEAMDRAFFEGQQHGWTE